MRAKGWSTTGWSVFAGMLLVASMHAGAAPRQHTERIGKAAVGFTKEQAVDYCYKKGLRLPTVRELATWAQTKGAIGVEESPNKDLAYPLEVDLMQRRGFDAIYLSNTPVQTVVDFYFNPKGFKRPRRTAQNARVWAGDTLNVNGGDGYTFTMGWPTFRAEDSRRAHAAVCIK